LNTETDVVNFSNQSDDYIIEGYIDLSAMQSGDTIIIKEYIAVDGTNQRLFINTSFGGSQDTPIIYFPAKLVQYDGKYRVTITQTAGTLRSFPYTFILQVLQVV
jgi:hypothetical protein